MNAWTSHLCMDAGGEYCPCYLSEINRCVNCSLLAGQRECGCVWSGSCIYSEREWNGLSPKGLRPTITATGVTRTSAGKNAYVLSIDVPPWMARPMRAPGSFCFLRPTSLPPYFDVPVSTMLVSPCNSRIHTAVQVVGPKTHALIERREALSLRGPFMSGILGLSSLKARTENALVIAKGISQGRGIHTAGFLARRGVDVTFLAGPGPVGRLFAEDWLDEPSIKKVSLTRTPDHNRGDIARALSQKSWDLVFSSGPDVQHKMILELVSEVSPTPRLAFTNNALMCCGEGICGACESPSSGGTPLRACKAVPDTESYTF